MIIRPEAEGDFPAIDEVVREAFGREDEAKLVRRLRDSDAYVSELALVAEERAEIVGHVMLTYAGLEGEGPDRVLSLAPLAVRPGRQRRGTGIALTRRALELADVRNEPVVVVLGHSSYYPRFGFESARQHGIEPPDASIPDESFMVVRLSAYEPHIRGRIVYPDAFDEG